jgi:fibronectin-binding autotransporter adhesin
MIRLCDGAARYATQGLADNTTYAKANYIAGQNTVDGQTLSFPASNVEVGKWDTSTRSFTVTSTSPNAVRVTMQRSVPAMFAALAGGTPKTITVRAIAKYNAVGFGLIGLNSLTFKGHATASYSSSNSSATTGAGSIASNGTISVGGSSTVNGNVYLGPSGQVSGGQINGTTNTLSSNLSYPNGSSAPYSSSNNNNSNFPQSVISSTNVNIGNNKNVTVPGGNYYFNDFTLSGGGTLAFTGPATIYVYGNLSLSGNTTTSSNIPGNLKIVMVPNPNTGAAPGSVTIGGGGALYASIYAPQSAVSISGNGNVYGSILGQNVSVTGTGSIYYDMDLDVNAGTAALVQ